MSESTTETALDRLAAGRYLPGDVDLLPLTIDAKIVAGALSLSLWALYAGVRAGTFPLPPLVLTPRRYRWRTRALLELLGIDEPTPAPHP